MSDDSRCSLPQRESPARDIDAKEKRKLINKRYYEKTKNLKDIGIDKLLETAPPNVPTTPPPVPPQQEKKKISTNQEITPLEESTILTDITNRIYDGLMGSVQTIIQTGLITGATVLVSYMMKQQQQSQKPSAEQSNQCLENVEPSFVLRNQL